MGEPKSIEITTDSHREGIRIEYIASRRVIRVSAWYDTISAIPTREIPLDTFIATLGFKWPSARRHSMP